MSRHNVVYIVAELDDGKIELGWSFRVYDEVKEALAEVADAHAAGMTTYRAYRLESQPVVVLVDPSPSFDLGSGPIIR